MTEKTDYEVELECKISDLNDQIAKLTEKSASDDTELTRLRKLIADKLSSPTVENPNVPKDFATLYKETVKELGD